MKYFIISLILISSIQFQLQAQFTGKPLYDVLVRQYPDTFGTFRMELYPAIAPLHCENFDTLAQQGFYDSLAFHRVVPNFVIQGGDPNSKTGPPSTWGQGAPWQQTVPAEFNPLSHSRSTIGAARGTDINSATSQFYVNLANNSGLNGNYTLYGKVISGMNVVDSVEDAPTGTNDRPIDKIDMFINYVGVDTSAPAMAPNLLTPADSAMDLFGDEQFTWTAVSNNDFLLYKIEFSRQSDFSSIEYSRFISKNTTSIEPLDNLDQGFVTYFWRVSTNNGGRVKYSETRSFSTYIAVPDLIFPLDQASGTSMNPILQWTPITAATQYNVVVSTLPIVTINNFKVVDTITWKSDFVPAPLDSNSRFYWAVRSIQNSVPGDFSEIWSFDTGNLINADKDEIEVIHNIYPNPNRGVFIVRNDNNRLGTIRITDVNGHLILLKKFANKFERVDISSQADGIYLFTIKTENGLKRGKIIKSSK